MNLPNVPPKLREYLDEARVPAPPLADPDEPLHIDSLALIRLVAFMESDLGIRIEDEELLSENFATLRAISNLIASKSQTGEPA
jgi:acyl carrier protein